MKKTAFLSVLTVAIALTAPAWGADPATVAANYTKHCSSCHGKDGKGQTTMGKKLSARDLSDKKVVAEIKDEVALKNLKEGVKDKAGKEIKKPFAAKLSEDEMKALIAYAKTTFVK